MTIAASLSQIGEFSFILAGLGVAMGILPEQGQRPGARGRDDLDHPQPDCLRADRAARSRCSRRRQSPLRCPPAATGVLVGYGRVGTLVAAALERSGKPFVVIESDAERIRELRERGIPFIEGNAASREILGAANPEAATTLVIAIPNAFEAGRIVKKARGANPGLTIVARAHSDAEIQHLRDLGVDTVIMGERQIALEMIAEIERLPSAATS